jgi:protein-disulfide isomerase
MHDLIFENQAGLSTANLARKTQEFAGSIQGVNLALYKNCIGGTKAAAVVDNDVSLGMAVEVRGTPTVFVDGRVTRGLRDKEKLRSAIVEAMREASGKTAAVAHGAEPIATATNGATADAPPRKPPEK